jgi:hypothetical protein
MAVDTSAVQIKINVIDGNSAETVSKVTKNLDQLGNAGGASGKKVKEGMDKVGISALDNRERVRLLTEEFGVRMPRAMVNLISESKAAQSAISAIGTAMVGLAAVQIGAMVFKQLYDGAERLWDNYLSLNKAAEDYNKELAKTKEEDFGNTRSIEDTRDRIQEATKAAHDYRRAAEEIRGGFFKETVGGLFSGGLSGMITAGATSLALSHSYAGSAVKGQRQEDKLTPKMAEQQHELAVRQIEYNHALDGTLPKLRKIAAEQAKQHELNAEMRRFNNQEDAAHGNPVAADAGATEESLKNRTADRQAQAELFSERKAHLEELAHLREAALEAGLRGTALYKAQEAAAIADLKSKDMDSVAARNAIHQKFHAEEMKRLEDEGRETAKIERAAAIAGLTGIPKIEAEGAGHMADINADASLSPEGKSRRIAAAQSETNQQILDAEREFTQHVNQLADESASHQMSALDRVRFDAQRQIAGLRKDYEKLYGKDVNAPEYQAHLGELNRGVGAVNANASDQQAELARRASEETAQIEMAAHARSMSAQKQQTVAIEAEYEARVRKYEEELRKREISDDDYNRRVLAAGEQRDAEMVEASKQAREKMAGEFSRFFQNPMGALKEFGNKAAGEATAALMQRVQGHLAGAPGSTRTASRGGILGGIFDHITGKPGAPVLASDHGIESHGMHRGSAGVISVASAQIHVGTASIALVGGGGGFGGGGGLMPALYRPGQGAMNSGWASGTGSMLSSTPSGTAGGAGDFGFGGGGGAGGFTGGTGMILPGGKGVGGILGNAQQAFSLGKSGIGLFKKTGFGGGGGDLAETQSDPLSGTLNADGTFSNSKSGGGMLGGGGVGANAMGAVGGAAGLYSAYEGNGGVGGALGGAMSGMQLGMAVGGPVGAAVGAAAGAIIGAIGFGGREKARVYDLKVVRPGIGNAIDGYQQGQMDYLSAYSAIDSLKRNADMSLEAMGPEGKNYYQDVVKKELSAAYAKLTQEQRAGRSQYTTSAAQFDQGGWTGDFGAMSTGADSGWAHMRSNEFVVHEQAAATHAGALEAIRAGASHEEMGRYYGADSRTMPAASSAGGDVHLHLNAIDGKSALQFLTANKHNIRAALNASYAENSGGADA